MLRFIALIAALTSVSCATAAAEPGDLPDWLKKVVKKDTLSDEKVVSGLKEALTVGSRNAVDLTGRPGGYFENEAIKILMPEKLRKLEKGLRAVGYGEELDEFVLSMNRAAEAAAPRAEEIFVGAIREMTFRDARDILRGGDTAATDYFREKTSEELTSTFTPIVSETMRDTGVKRHYDGLVERYTSLPFVREPKFDVDEYVVGEALDGLFTMLAAEERKIREDPAARVTDILKEVFGSR